MTATIRLSLGCAALLALSLDDPQMQTELEVTVEYHGRRTFVSGTPENMSIVVNDLFDRANPSEGFEHYGRDLAALKRAAKSVRTQLHRHGYTVARPFGRVLKIVPVALNRAEV